MALIGNGFLLILKLALGIYSGSLAVISDALHSMMDVIASAVIAVGVKIGSQSADKEHPFGHHRAEPIAALIIAVIAGILAFEVAQKAVIQMFSGDREILAGVALIALGITVVVKLVMSWYFRKLSKKLHSPSIRALAIDSRNDVAATLVALVGVALAGTGLVWFDSLASLVVAGFIFKGGYEIGVENIDYLMGKTADEDLIRTIRLKALSVRGVLALNTLRSHYVGNKIHVEIHIEVDYRLTTRESHQISDDVEAALQTIPEIAKAFVHVDPVEVLADGTRRTAGFHESHPELD